MNINYIFFDFDGVLAESVHVKTQAFHDLYLPHGEDIAEKAVKHHRANGGMSRFEKFKLYHSRFLNEEIDESEVQKLASQFSDLVVGRVVNAPEVPGAEEFLEKYSEVLDYWIITGTPTEEMKQIAERRGIMNYFEEICGSPTGKNQWTEYLLNSYNLQPDQVMFLGDSTSDYEAAQTSGVHFALRDYEENRDLFSDYEGLRFSDFYDLETKIELD